MNSVRTDRYDQEIIINPALSSDTILACTSLLLCLSHIYNTGWQKLAPSLHKDERPRVAKPCAGHSGHQCRKDTLLEILCPLKLDHLVTWIARETGEAADGTVSPDVQLSQGFRLGGWTLPAGTVWKLSRRELSW